MNFIAIAGILGAALVAGTYKLQFFIIYPSNFPEGSREVVDRPDEYGMPFEDVQLPTPDGETIHLYVIPRADATITVLFLGPNAGNMGNGLPLVKLVHDLGYNVVTLSYRGYGKSTGSPNEKGLKTDVRTTLEYIKEHPKLAGSKLVLYGRSLGGAVAIYAATHAPPDLVSAVILENTFTSIPEVAPAVVPFVPQKLADWAITQRWESYKLIGKLDVPVLFQAGGKDELIPPAMFRRLHDLCGEKKEYNLYPQGTHNDTVVQQGYWDDVAAFLKRV